MSNYKRTKANGHSIISVRTIRPSFITGLARVFDMNGAIRTYRLERTRRIPDFVRVQMSFRRNLERVGSYFYSAMNNLK